MRGAGRGMDRGTGGTGGWTDGCDRWGIHGQVGWVGNR